VLKRILALAALGGLVALPACTSNQAAVEPHFTPVNTSTSELQFQVGTATYGANIFLNTVVTFRQPNGLSALLADTPSIALPFTNTASAAVAFNDSGKPQITGTPETDNGVASTDPRTFAQTVGAFAYGFLASNSITTGANNSVFYPATNRQPYYGAPPGFAQRAFYVGPGNQYVPNFKDGSLGFSAYDGSTGSFPGYPSGFTTFSIHPTTGTYVLSVGLPLSSTPIPTFTATTALANLGAALAPQAPPTYASDHLGGGTITVTTPANATETAVFIRDLSPAGAVLAYYTVVAHGVGPHTLTLADNLGIITGGVAAPSIATGDTVSLTAVSFDYPAMEAVPVGSGPPQAPVINNGSTACTFSGTSSTCPGQADLTVSTSASATE
jgi:hypothetical protein